MLIKPKNYSNLNGDYYFSDKGYVYILTNPIFKFFSEAFMKDPLVKIGFTNKSPQERCFVLSSSTSIPLDFELAYSIQCFKPYLVEQLTHKYLEIENRRLNPLKEFFFVNIEYAKCIINSINNVVEENSFCLPEGKNSIEEADFVTPFDIIGDEQFIDSNNIFSIWSKNQFFELGSVPAGLNTNTWEELKRLVKIIHK